MVGIEDVKKRLRQFGYEARAEDDPALAFSIEKSADSVKSEIHQKSVPKELRHVVIDMAAGEFLMGKKTFSPSDLEALDFGPAVKQVQEGDTNTVFAAGEGSMTDEQRLNAFINHLFNGGRTEIYHYRRLRW